MDEQDFTQDTLDYWREILGPILDRVVAEHQEDSAYDRTIQRACTALREPDVFLGVYAVLPLLLRLNPQLIGPFCSGMGADIQVVAGGVPIAPTSDKVH